MSDRRRDIKKDLTATISSLVSHLKVNEPLKNHTTFHIGGPAKYFVDVSERDELKKLHDICLQNKISFLILGNGSNVLIGDEGFDGLVMRLKGEFSLITSSRNAVKVGSGVQLPVLLQKCLKKNLSGLEFLSGIPGTVGGAVVGNAGTKEGWIGDKVVDVEVLTNSGRIVTLKRKDLKFSYRSSNLNNYIIISATLLLKKGQKNDILKKINGLLLKRSKEQPLNEFNSGSVFKNPENKSAGELIENAGLKGLKFGGAKISEKHANFIVNFENARASDVKTLISIIHQKVKEKFGIDLELEIKLIGV
ncbi:MAG: UDP-N-acetylmuramate dehydrogenase [Endomicrobiales bacterium]|nr:UDP-N-acetylmuramate dehydrogenase [Endomicrobiales bacterium]